jgi:hypothetical protein
MLVATTIRFATGLVLIESDPWSGSDPSRRPPESPRSQRTHSLKLGQPKCRQAFSVGVEGSNRRPLPCKGKPGEPRQRGKRRKQHL